MRRRPSCCPRCWMSWRAWTKPPCSCKGRPAPARPTPVRGCCCSCCAPAGAWPCRPTATTPSTICCAAWSGWPSGKALPCAAPRSPPAPATTAAWAARRSRMCSTTRTSIRRAINWWPAPRGCSPAPSSSRRSTICSSTKRARSAWPTSSPWASARATSCCWATRCSSASPARARIRAVRANRRWSTCSTARPPSRRRRASSCDTSYRMHPEICGFISEAIYDGRLRAAPATAAHRLLLDEAAGRELPAHGIRYLPVPHDGNTQSSREEAARVAELCALLLRQRHVDEAGAPAPLTLDDILFVAPYNVQVNTLRAALPDGARVGTVDKFQGQEAQVVIVSMATSSGDYLPRDLEFLFSRNRLNVAISRARTLAILVASPALTAVRCRSAEQMALVNTLCWVAETGSASPYQV
ncbi:AAA domain protein [Bordetella bronchiseptica F2]|nr:AAA domain protein [Bordetella bronchiseptica F-1]KDC24418.1 AAA domain protein [Bordetella bronchiseptica F2]